jgi:hypothetical protein
VRYRALSFAAHGARLYIVLNRIGNVNADPILLFIHYDHTGDCRRNRRTADVLGVARPFSPRLSPSHAPRPPVYDVAK